MNGNEKGTSQGVAGSGHLYHVSAGAGLGVFVESGEHFTAEEIRERASAILPGLELSTVYRAPEAPGEVGLVAESRLPKRSLGFESRTATHPRLAFGREEAMKVERRAWGL